MYPCIPVSIKGVAKTDPLASLVRFLRLGEVFLKNLSNLFALSPKTFIPNLGSNAILGAAREAVIPAAVESVCSPLFISPSNCPDL